MATDADRVVACKIGLGIQLSTTDFDSLILQKIGLVQGFMAGAGVGADVLNSDAATPVIVLGVGDAWSLGTDELKFSLVFMMLLGQLVAKSSLLTVAVNPADGAADVSIDVKPVLTFCRRLASYCVSLTTYDAQVVVSVSTVLDITGTVVTVVPSAALAAGTKYALVIEATAADGPGLGRTVVAFTTAG